jgi:hypothetical protein
MELAIHENLASPFVEKMDDRVRVHLPLGMSAVELGEHFNDELDHAQLETAKALLASDDLVRSFETHEGFVVIRNGGETA